MTGHFIKCQLEHAIYIFLGHVLYPLYSCDVRQLFVGGLMSYFRCVCLFAYSGVQHILWCVCVVFFFVLLLVCLDWPLCIAPSVFSNDYSRYLCLLAHSGVQHILCCIIDFLSLVYPRLPVSLDFPFFVGPSVFSTVYVSSCLRRCRIILQFLYNFHPYDIDSRGDVLVNVLDLSATDRWLDPGQCRVKQKDCIIDIYCFSSEHTESLCTVWMVRNQETVSQWIDMTTCWSSTNQESS